MRTSMTRCKGTVDFLFIPGRASRFNTAGVKCPLRIAKGPFRRFHRQSVGKKSIRTIRRLGNLQALEIDHSKANNGVRGESYSGDWP